MRAVEHIVRGAKRLGVPLYSNACSKHAFTQHQLLVLVVLRQRLAKSYREFVDWLEVMTALRRRLRLRALPHFTTLHKFSLRLDERTLDGLVATLASSTASDGVLAVDSTGMQSGSASFYFVQTLSLRRDDAGTMELRRHKRHIKLTLAVDVDTQMIVSLLTSPGPGPDFEHLRPAVAKAASGGFAVTAVLADRGYDSESNRRFVVQELGAETHIPLRKIYRNASGHGGKFRHRQERVFDHSLYRRRVLAETVNSVIKRTMSSTALARRERSQYAELALRAAAHNARRAAELLG